MNMCELTSSGQPLDQDTNPCDFCNDHWCTMDDTERNDDFYYQRQPLPQVFEIQEMKMCSPTMSVKPKIEKHMPHQSEDIEQRKDELSHPHGP